MKKLLLAAGCLTISLACLSHKLVSNVEASINATGSTGISR